LFLTAAVINPKFQLGQGDGGDSQIIYLKGPKLLYDRRRFLFDDINTDVGIE
jgi:hypothetical protein